MRIWIDLANTPHVPLLAPLVERFRADGHEPLLTVRDTAQTAELALSRWPEAVVIGGPSPDGRLAKGAAIWRRAVALRRYARRTRPAVAFAHGSYGQLLAARAARIPAVTMMDYEHQPANHLSFRLAQVVIVPNAFGDRELRRAGARPRKVVRYEGFKEQLYLESRELDATVLEQLELDCEKLLVVMRPAPDGALYHRMENDRFDELLGGFLERRDVQVVVLARRAEQRERYRRTFPAAVVPERAVDAASLLALADATIGAGGTMTRESAVLGTPTYTVFAGRLAGVDSELMRRGLLHDLRAPDAEPVLRKRDPAGAVSDAAGVQILETVVRAVYAAAGRAK